MKEFILDHLEHKSGILLLICISILLMCVIALFAITFFILIGW